MWPGYGENCRVLDWILRRIDNEPGTAQQTPIGNVPTRESFDARGLDVDFDGLFSVPIDFWTEEVSCRRPRYSVIDYSRFVWLMYLPILCYFAFSGQRSSTFLVRTGRRRFAKRHTRPNQQTIQSPKFSTKKLTLYT